MAVVPVLRAQANPGPALALPGRLPSVHDMTRSTPAGGRHQAGVHPPLVRSPRRMAMPEHGMVVFESHHAPGFAGTLTDGFAKFLLVVAGGASWEARGQEIRLTTGTLCHVPAGLAHAQRDHPGAPVALYAIHYRPELIPAEAYQWLAAPGLLPVALADGGRQVRALFQELLFEQDARQSGWQALMLARLNECAVLCLRQGTAPPAAARSEDPTGGRARVGAYALQLRSGFFRAQTIDEAAQAVQLSRRQFTALFRAVSGESWREHLLRLRLEHAQRLLSESERSITAVAFESGFDDLSHFHHSFKTANGCTPGEYRAARRPPPHGASPIRPRPPAPGA
jgi:AraC family L-rhamnose operon regulatory protein RhaS